MLCVVETSLDVVPIAAVAATRVAIDGYCVFPEVEYGSSITKGTLAPPLALLQYTENLYVPAVRFVKVLPI